MNNLPLTVALNEEVASLTDMPAERSAIGYHCNVYLSLHGAKELLTQINGLKTMYPHISELKIDRMYANMKQKIQELYANIQL